MPEFFWDNLAWFIIPPILAFAYWIHVYQNSRSADIYRKLRARRGGSVKPGGFLSNTRFEFVHRGVSFVLSTFHGSDNTPDTTYVDAELDAAQVDHEFTILTDGLNAKFNKALQLLKDTETGHADFDEAFVLQTDSPERVMNWLSPEVMERLLKDAERLEHFRVLKGRFSYTVRGRVESLTALDALIETALILYDAVSESSSSGRNNPESDDPRTAW